MLILGHTLPELRKALIATASLILTGIALFVVYDPSLKEAIIVLTGNAVGVIAVFALPFSIENFSKAVGALVTSVQSVLAFFFVINPSIWVVIGSVIAYLPAIYYFVWKVPNAQPINMTIPPPAPPRPAITGTGGAQPRPTE